jgi:hypothetical protein
LKILSSAVKAAPPAHFENATNRPVTIAQISTPPFALRFLLATHLRALTQALGIVYRGDLNAMLLGRAASKDEMRALTDATRQLIKGESIRLRPCMERVKGRVELAGFGSRVLSLKASARGTTRVRGSGGPIWQLLATLPRRRQR